MIRSFSTYIVRFRHRWHWFILAIFSLALVVMASLKAVDAPGYAAYPSAIKTAAATSSSTVLSLDDLPLGFQAFPAKWKNYVDQGTNHIRNYFKQSNININQDFAYLSLAAFEVVLGFTAPLASNEISEIDTRIRHPVAVDRFMQGLQQGTQLLQPIQVSNQGTLKNLNNIGNVVTGNRLYVNYKGLPYALFADVVAFRRNDTAVLLIVGSFGVPSRLAKVENLAQILDRKIQLASSPKLSTE